MSNNFIEDIQLRLDALRQQLSSAQQTKKALEAKEPEVDKLRLQSHQQSVVLAYADLPDDESEFSDPFLQRRQGCIPANDPNSLSRSQELRAQILQHNLSSLANQRMIVSLTKQVKLAEEQLLLARRYAIDDPSLPQQLTTAEPASDHIPSSVVTRA